jgi:8-oxo-dGTP diphosphatase
VPQDRKFKRRARPTIPTTRVSAIVISEEDKILLVKHRKGSKTYWVLPGGRLEYGETFETCAIREIKEETGLVISIDGFAFLSEAIAPDKSRHIINIYVYGHVTGGELQLGKDRVLAGVEWVPVSELQTMTLFPPVSKQILEARSNSKSRAVNELKYLGQLWV